MPYSDYLNHSSYYAAQQNDRTTQNAYASSQSNVPASSYRDPVAYNTKAQQTEYMSQDCSWPTSHQHSYNTNHTGTGQFSGDAYRKVASGQTYDDYRAHRSHIGSNKRQAETQPYSNSVSQVPKHHSSPALNERIYASGLESSGTQIVASSRFVEPPQRNDIPRNSTATPIRPKSSDMHTQQTYGEVPPSLYGSQNTYRTREHSQLALQAAAALQSLPKNSRAKFASPANSPMPPPLAASQERPQSPCVASKDTSLHQCHPSSQSCDYQQSSGPKQTSNPSAMSQPQSFRPQQSYSATPNNAAPGEVQSTDSITNLATDESRPESTTYPSLAEQSKSTIFLNPREVFNQNHREHEILQREATATEAASKGEATDKALKSKNTSTAAPAAESRSDYVIHEPSSRAANLNSKPATKAKSLTFGPTSETDTKAEISQITARITEVRGKDAALFQNVFDDEKGASAAKPSGVSSIAFQKALPTTARVAAAANGSFIIESPSTPSSQRDPDMPRGSKGYTEVTEGNEAGFSDLGNSLATRRGGYSHNNRKQQALPTNTPQMQLPPTLTPAAVPAINVIAQSGPILFDPNIAPDSVPTMQPLPTRSKDGTTAWLEPSYEGFTTEAIKFLKSSPRHELLSISEADFDEMLRGKPSYITLCHLLEARGFRFNKNLFARYLMANVPGLSASKGNAEPSPNPPVLTQSHPQSAVSAAFIPPAANHVLTFMNGPYVKPEMQLKRSSAAAPLTNQRNTSLAARARSQLRVLTPRVPAQTPGSKEYMARKRGFDDLFDLTNEDDKNYVALEKRPRLRSASPDPIAISAKQLQPLPKSQSSVVRFGIPPSHDMLPKAVAPLRFDATVPDTLAERSKLPRSSQVVLAKKLNKAEALRRNYYDPKTVARDILISAGQHPTERALNGHLAGLLDNHIEIESDLSTFRWEDVDPGGPPPPKTAWTDLPAGPPRFKSQKPRLAKYNTLATMGGDHRYQSVQKLISETPDLTHDLVRNISIAASKHLGRSGSGDFSMVQEHESSPPRKTGRPPRHLLSSSSEPRDNSSQAAHHAERSLRILSQQTKALVNESLKLQTRPPPGQRQSQAAANEVETQSSQATPPKKRGHPRQESNLLESSVPLSTDPPLRKVPGGPSRSTVSPDVQKSARRPPGSIYPSQRSVSVEVPKMEDSLRPSSERNDRPPGVKNKISSSDNNSGGIAVQVVIPRLRSEDEPPEYPVFKCRWVKCGAELHNISTLRRHIAKLHKPARETVNAVGYGCYWKRCSLLRRYDEGNIEPTPIPTEQQWLDHINEEHIHPLGQKFGDGPSTAHIGKQNQPFEAIVSKYFYNPSLFPTDARIVSYTDPQAVASDRAFYLADESGRTTTHLTHYDDEPDAVVLADFHTKEIESNKAAENAFKSFLKNHGHTKLDMRAAADETFKAMAVRKERTGVGIDRGGCTLVSEERRRTFVQNPGISRIVENDY